MHETAVVAAYCLPGAHRALGRYWEGVDMLRKLSIVGAGAVFANQRGAEPFAVLLIACLWLLVQMWVRPYRFTVSAINRQREPV